MMTEAQRKRMVVLGLVLIAAAFAVCTGIAAHAADAVPAADTGDISYKDDIKPFVHVVKNWNTVGFLATVSALCGLLSPLIKRKPMGPWLSARRIKDVPVVQKLCVLPIVGGVLGSYSLFNLANGLLAGVLGFSAAWLVGQKQTALAAGVSAFLVGFNPVGHTSGTPAAAPVPAKPA